VRNFNEHRRDNSSAGQYGLYGEGHSWKDNNVPKEKVLEVNSRIAKGSEELWANLEKWLEKAAADGFFA
jgi:putative hydrolase of HD superfamily